MRTIGNVIWFILCGVWLGIAYILAGIVSCITIIGIPFGIQSFKLAGYVMWPFGRQLVESPGNRFSKGVFNIIWIIFGGIWLAITHVIFGILLCITILGIPFGIKNFSMAKLALFPFDFSVEHKGDPGPNEAPLTSDN
ncbi:MAG: YccF domain-containing protein [Actinobacteria bacterium]|nr:YccF domain-containing protein [Actinomycetota bacterium]